MDAPTLTPALLAAELREKLPRIGYDDAKACADLIAAAAFKHWPQNPRWFTWLLVAIGSRETNWKNVLGADKHGRGYLQIDDRAHKDWYAEGHDGFDPPQNIDEGAAILAWGLRLFTKEGIRAGVACYNCGPKNVRSSLATSQGASPDLYTTGHNYGINVLARLDRLMPGIRP
jgi:hypothetical protein